MVRDFTKEAYDELLAQVDSINNVPFQEELINRVSGTPVLSNLFAGQFGGAFNEIKEYQELFFNRLHLNKSNIDRIFQDVNTVNYDYKHLYDEYKNDVLTHIRLISNLSDSFGQPNDTAFYLSVVALKSTFEKIKDQYIDDLYKEYISGRLSLTDEQMYLIKDKLADAYLSGILTPSENDMKYIHMYYDEEVARLQSDYDGIRSIYINEIATEEKLVNLFRAFNPDIAADLDTFFSSATEGSVQPYDIMNITFIAMTAEEPYKSLFFEVIGDITLGKVEHQYYDATNNQYVTVTNQFMSASNSIDFDDSGPNNAFLNCRKGPYVTFFHEIGHAIDYNTQNTNMWYSQLYWGASLYDTIQRDVTNDIKAEILSISENNPNIPPLNQETISMITAALIEGDINMITDSNFRFQRQYRDIYNDVIAYYQDPNISYLHQTHSIYMYNAYFDAAWGLNNPTSGGASTTISAGLSDIFAGVTDSNIFGSGWHAPNNNQSYWYNSNGSPNGNLQRETYAHYFSFAVTGNDEALDLMSVYLPETIPMLDDMSNEMLEIYMEK